MLNGSVEFKVKLTQEEYTALAAVCGVDLDELKTQPLAEEDPSAC